MKSTQEYYRNQLVH